MQLQSMRAYNPAGFGQDPGLHFITQRYALLTTSLLSLNADYQVPCASQPPPTVAPILSPSLHATAQDLGHAKSHIFFPGAEW